MALTDSQFFFAMNDSIEVLQQTVQRKLGRCMLRLQQYERLLKAMVASMGVEGPLEQLQALQARRINSVHHQTLGALVGMFTSAYLTAASPDAEIETDDEIGCDSQSIGVAWASIRFTMSMPPESHAQIKEGLAELVALRNDLVHHLIERFDIVDEDDCRAAISHLDNCYEKIDRQCQHLDTWAREQAQCRELASSFMQSKAFEDALVHGINPDGSVCWPRCTIVECLNQAQTACQVDGWTSLDAAIAFISKESRDQIPSRYGCKTWRQVLMKSGQFELRRVVASDGAMGRVWYRSCAAL